MRVLPGIDDEAQRPHPLGRRGVGDIDFDDARRASAFAMTIPSAQGHGGGCLRAGAAAGSTNTANATALGDPSALVRF